ncbi:MAG: hypothetical protein JOZ94_06500, partial [Xanthobacteraceae bacterium]|nr:hypothetical protein [Xanthobacteraceae bacterium]
MLLGAGLGALALASPQAAHAVDATWTTALGNDWQNGASWSGGVVPDGTAIFTNNGANTSVGIFSGLATINTIRFDPGSPAYGIFTFNFSSELDIVGAGIINNSTSIQQFSAGNLNFRNSATAGNANIFNDGTVNFFNSSTAGNATISNDNPLRTLQFIDTSSAGNAIIFNNGTVLFAGSSTAGNATITTIFASNFGFFNSVEFFNTSTAGNATITTNNGAVTTFQDNSSGGNARFITNAGGNFDISALSGGGTTAGSIEGAGNYFLGSKTLTVGSNNLSTEVSGVIRDGSFFGGTAAGGSLVKVGSATLTLSGINAYTG